MKGGGLNPPFLGGSRVIVLVVDDGVVPEVVKSEAAECGQCEAGLAEILPGDVTLPAPLDTEAPPD